MKKIFIAAVLLIGVALHTYAQDYPVISKEYCDCFSKLKDSMEVEFQNIVMKVAVDTNSKKAFQNELKALDTDKRKRFGTQLEYIGRSMETADNDAGKCGAALDAKYKQFNETPEKEKIFNTKMIEELYKNSECKFLAALVKFALEFSEED